MDETTQVEYAGLAATVGRLMSTLKQCEAALADAGAKLAEYEAAEPGTNKGE